MEKFYDDIVENVKMLRKSRKISQLKLANILEFKSLNYIAKIETRRHDVTYNLGYLYKISKEFKIDINDLIPTNIAIRYVRVLV